MGGKQQQTHIFRPISLHSHVILAKNSKSRKAKKPRTHLLGLEKSKEIFHPFFPPSSSTSRIHNSASYCRQQSKATRKIENENHLLATRPSAHPPFEQHRVSLVEAIYYREMASGLANTYTRRWKFIVICVVFPYVQISLSSPSLSSPTESRRKFACSGCCFSFSHPPDHRKSVPSHRRAFGSATANVYVASYNNNANGYDEAKKKKKGRITYIKRQLDRWKVCFFILRKNILRIFSNFGGDVMCFPFSSPQCVSLARYRKPFGEKGHNFELCPVIISGIQEKFSFSENKKDWKFENYEKKYLWKKWKKSELKKNNLSKKNDFSLNEKYP